MLASLGWESSHRDGRSFHRAGAQSIQGSSMAIMMKGRKSTAWFAVLWCCCVRQCCAVEAATRWLRCPFADRREFVLNTNEIVKIKQSNYLCTLSRTDPYRPVARSYSNHPWERSGGAYAAAMEDEWKCKKGVCKALLPAGSYVLRTHKQPIVRPADAWARWLESTTFGTTRDDLEKATTATAQQHPRYKDFAQYLQNQIQEIPATSHREFYRRRLNPMQEHHFPMFAARLNPCAVDSYWSPQYLSIKDLDRDIVISTTTSAASNSTRVISVANEVRAARATLRYEQWGDQYPEVPDGRYRICGGAEAIRRGYLSLIPIGRTSGCLRIPHEDTLIDFVDNEYSPDHVLMDRVLLNDTNRWQRLPAFQAAEPVYRHLNQTNSPWCPFDSRVTSPMKVDIFADDSKSAAYIRTIDGRWLVHQPVVDLLDNSLYQPHRTGARREWKKGLTRHCSNAPRSFLNEDQCVLANSVRACRLSGPTEVAGVVCGSPGEVSNDRSLGDSWLDVRSMTAQLSDVTGLPKDVLNEPQFTRQRELVWYEIARTSPDQLRQRMAWALKQIFSLPKSSITNEQLMTESFLGYFDIFVRNAFGNYRDILREIAYHPLMAESLSYVNSRSLASAYWNTNSTLAYPDENFARELMQLFTIGLEELNMDGSPVQDAATKATRPTYDNDDIANFARVWTGFVHQPLRSNMENPTTRNPLDPMTIVPSDRDRFPKTDLIGGYIGDVYPLCVDLPDKSYLRAGAKYRLLGKQPVPEKVPGDDWFKERKAIRVQLSKNTPLYSKLCAPVAGKCTYPSLVVLDENLSCPECTTEEVRLVKVGGIYYEYTPVPCVEHSFYNNGKVAYWGKDGGHRVCVDKRSSAASEACCTQDDTTSARSACKYAGERMTYTAAQSRCNASKKTLCAFKQFSATRKCSHVGYHWTPDDCKMKVKIDRRGFVAVIHDVARPHRFIREDLSPNFFKVYWKDGEYPAFGAQCRSVAGCKEVDGDCICGVEVSEEPVFTTAPSVNSIKNTLRIGYPAISMFDNGEFKEIKRNGYTLYSRDGSCCDSNSVFSVESNGVTKLYKNMKSTVRVTGSSFEFRNSPSFNSLVPTEFSRYSAEYETEAVLDHFFYHKNTAPFVARRIIQRFGMSNPSPRYVKVVAEAFQSGSVTIEGFQFGSGKYGDLAATVARVLLDREVRSNRMLSDPSGGSSREPVLKVLSLMRAMELQTSVPLLDLDLLDAKIGQAPYEQLSVFNFFRPEYSPPGIVSSATLVSPEAEVMSTGKVVGLLNGMFSVFKYGLENCGSGFGSFGCHEEWHPSRNVTSGSFSLPFDAADRVQEMTTMSRLLTAGRLSTEKQNLIRAATSQLSDHQEAMTKMAQFIVTTPEFHTTTSTAAPVDRVTDEYSRPTANRPNDGYKAIIHISLRGGCDSFNMLMPHTSCGLYDSYKAVRDKIAINPSDTLPVQATGQPCSTFGVHNELSRVQSLYDDSELLFFANTGVLTKPVTKDDYKTTRTNLFAHNSMQDEIDTLDPFNTAAGTGTLGRLADALEDKGYKVGRTSVESSPINLSGMDGKNSPVSTLDENGVQPFDSDFSNSTAAQLIKELNGQGAATGVHGELWSTSLLQAVNQSNTLYYILESNRQNSTFADTNLGRRMRLISQLIETRIERDVDRDVFYVTLDGFDHHSDTLERLEDGFHELNEALGSLVDALGPDVWKDVVVVQTSDFGRTLTPNSNQGSDHGWGGNYFMAGGSVKGKQIMGEYPSTFDETGSQNVGQGRLIPTTPFDSCFNGIAEWVGVNSPQSLTTVLPNRNNFRNLFTAAELFKSG